MLTVESHFDHRPENARHSRSRRVSDAPRCRAGIREPSLRIRVDGPCSATVRAVVLLGLLSLAGCISVQKFEEPPLVLRDAIRNGELVAPGQHVSIVTTSRGEMEFRVTEVDRNVVRGIRGAEKVEIPIEDIVALQTRRIDFRASAGVAAGWFIFSLAVNYLAVVL